MKHLIYEKGGIIEQWEKGRSLQYNIGTVKYSHRKKKNPDRYLTP